MHISTVFSYDAKNQVKWRHCDVTGASRHDAKLTRISLGHISYRKSLLPIKTQPGWRGGCVRKFASVMLTVKNLYNFGL